MVSKRRPRNVKIIFPSTITTFSMIFGFIAILLACHDQIDKACYFVMISILMDGLDGKVARLTNTASDFGIQYDSLSDLVAFGVTPCVIYSRFFLHLQVEDQVYYLLPIMFLVCGAIRLARFNVTASIYGKAYFTGLPIPAAAFAVIVLPIFDTWIQQSFVAETLGLQTRLTKDMLFQFSLGLVIALSLSMISTIKFDTPAGFWFRKFRTRWLNYLVLGLFLCLNFISFPLFCAAISAYYLLYTYGRVLAERIRKTESLPLPEEDLDQVP